MRARDAMRMQKGARKKGLGWVCKAAGGELKLRVGETEALRRLAALAFKSKHQTYTTFNKQSPSKIIHDTLKSIQ